MHRIVKGLDLPITGEPQQSISEGNALTQVALLGDDYVGMKPRMMVKAGDRVLKGQKVFEDRKNEGVFFTAPAAGIVSAVNRGKKRRFLSLVIDLADEQEHVTFENYASDLDGEATRALMIESGSWTTLRARPFNRVPAVDSQAEAIFVNGMDTEPLSGDVDVIIEGHEAAFAAGLRGLRSLTEGNVYLCVAPGSRITAGDAAGIDVQTFSGPHPAGLSGTHIHTLSPASRAHEQWSIRLQDTIALGYLLQTGTLYSDRVVAICGPNAKSPRLVQTHVGASLTQLCDGEATDSAETRVISGSVLSGRSAMGAELGWLGASHVQVSMIREDRDRHFIGWLTPGANMFSTMRIYLSSLMPGKKFAMTSNAHGQARAMVPIGMYEKVMPLDMMPTFLLRALIVGDLERAEQLGALELDEEDLALCTFVCPGKYEYGPILSERLAEIHKEG
ncbi:MAG TPA: NADH:ubiquinone reductase (Na(+)-transporting) subunit A [Myxococcales bacterium]|nr:NADH:ubiquinone reductase (Na(+)-transporting) subunit A [Myxococcales bacterium]HAN30340.1 NADH:ubiquinone reductase (Na(+)-transporting) subunit A [Myxococcales bacterium]